MSPMAPETPSPRIAAETGKLNVQAILVNCVIPVAIAHEKNAPRRIPIIPPSPVSITASRRNCVRMFLYVAPSAFLSPISFVRSVTETSIMFIMPIPPTMSEIAATAARNIVSTEVIEERLFARLTCVITKKSSLVGSVILCDSRRVSETSSEALGTSSSLTASMTNRLKYLMPRT